MSWPEAIVQVAGWVCGTIMVGLLVYGYVRVMADADDD